MQSLPMKKTALIVVMYFICLMMQPILCAPPLYNQQFYTEFTLKPLGTGDTASLKDAVKTFLDSLQSTEFTSIYYNSNITLHR